MNSSLKRYARIGLALFIAVLLIAAISGSAAAAGPVYHTVQPGQTLFSISNMYGVSVWAMACANGLYNPNYIYAGMILVVPSGWYGYCRPGYNQYGYNQYGYNQNGYNQYGYYHPAYRRPYAYDCYYRVRWGDTLYSIAWRYGTSYWTLASANGLYNPNYIYAGMVMRIPGCN
jgi:LysM repeat protein